MELKQFITPGLAVNTYVLYDSHTSEAVVIDPVRIVDNLIHFIEQEHLHVRYILETHVHADFISGAKELKSRLKQKPEIACSGLGGPPWTPKYADIIIQDFQTLQIGENTLQARHTPGHTPEHIMWILNNESAFTGDFLFVGSVGRPDLLGANQLKDLSKQLYQSVFNILTTYPDALTIYPAHGAGSFCGKSIGTASSSILGTERKNNPFLIPQSEDTWTQQLLAKMPKAPHYFQRIKTINVTGAPLLSSLPPFQQIPQKDLPSDVEIIDLRHPEKFAEAHLPQSLQITNRIFAPFGLDIIPFEAKNLILIADDLPTAKFAFDLLRLAGFDQKISYVLAPLDKKILTTTSYPVITSNEALSKKEDYYFLDVRMPEEWANGHIEGSICMELGDLPQKWKELPQDKPLITVCGAGFRSSVAASFLSKKGMNVYLLKEGMQGWQKAKLPILV